MPGALHGRAGAATREDRVARVAFERAHRRRPSGDGHRVTALGTAFGDEEVPVFATLEEVGPFGELSAGPRPERPERGEERSRFRIDLDLLDASPGGEGDETPPVPVPGDVGIDSLDLSDANGLRPGAGRVLRGDEDLPLCVGDVGGDHPESSVVVSKGRGENPAGGAGTG